MTINCIIIDDDPIVRHYLRTFALQTPFLNLLSVHQSSADALKSMETGNVQLIFLDVGMPDINGMELANILRNNKGESAPRIIFISGFERFAVDGYKVDAIAYLLKPATYEDFLTAAYKAKTYFENLGKAAETVAGYAENDFIFVRVEHELARIYLKNILYLESFKDYVKVYVVPGESYIKALTTMKSIEEKLPGGSFMRVHRSFIVSLDKIDTISKNSVKIGKIIIPVTEQFKENFKEFVSLWH